jgi:hypothetical protein
VLHCQGLNSLPDTSAGDSETQSQMPFRRQPITHLELPGLYHPLKLLDDIVITILAALSVTARFHPSSAAGHAKGLTNLTYSHIGLTNNIENSPWQ